MKNIIYYLFKFMQLKKIHYSIIQAPYTNTIKVYNYRDALLLVQYVYNFNRHIYYDMDARYHAGKKARSFNARIFYNVDAWTGEKISYYINFSKI